MKKVFLTTAVIVLFYCQSFAHIISTNEFSIDIPEGWTTIEVSVPDILLAEYNAGSVPMNLLLTRQSLLVEGGDAKAQKEASIETLKSIFSGINIIESKDNYWIFEEDLSDQQMPLTQIQYFYVKGDIVYILKFSCSSTMFKSMRESFEKIEKTLSIR